MEKKDVIIELTGVSKVYDGTTVVDNFNLYVNKGEFITFLGPFGLWQNNNSTDDRGL
jgi:spermidine/putrescine transport system ATP-binding protein